jgi:hypothetical protein
MKTINFEQFNLQSISLEEMTEISGGDVAYDMGYDAGVITRNYLMFVGVCFMFLL